MRYAFPPYGLKEAENEKVNRYGNGVGILFGRIGAGPKEDK
jgi:hypothetical protein